MEKLGLVLTLIFFYSHYWDCDEPDPQYAGSFDATSAYTLASYYWYGFSGWVNDEWVKFDGLVEEYNKGNKSKAYYYLGRVAHLLADSSVPAHVHNDWHLPANEDSYEEYLGCEYFRYNSTGNESIPEKNSLYEIFYELAQTTQWIASDGDDGNSIDENGNQLNYSVWGKWNTSWQDKRNFYNLSANCGWPREDFLDEVAEELMPLIFRYTASMFKLFWETVHPKKVMAMPWIPLLLLAEKSPQTGSQLCL